MLTKSTISNHSNHFPFAERLGLIRSSLFQLKRSLGVLAFLILISFNGYAQPTTQASDIVIRPVSGQTNQLTFSWTPGTPANKVLVVVSDATASFTPVNNVAYTATGTPNFTNDADIKTGGTGKAIAVYSSTGSTNITVQGLPPNADYRIQIFEYTDASSNELYNLNGSVNNPLLFKAFTNPGTTSWSTPAGVTTATVQAWGAGGGGGGVNGGSTRAGGGGGGGAYIISSNTAVTGAISVTVGNGGIGGVGNNSGDTDGQDGGNSSFGGLVAFGGNGGVTGGIDDGTGSGGIGGNVSGAGNVDGGAGAGGSTSAPAGGGGGGGAGNAGAGNATSPTGGSGGNGGGNGGNGATTSGNGSNGNFPGGGAGGGYDNTNNDSNNRSGGIGANGMVLVSYSIPAIPSGLNLAATDDLGTSNSDNITSKDDLTINGTGTPGSTIQLLNSGNPIGSTTTVLADGTWSIVLSDLTEGTYELTATATMSGNTSAASSPSLDITVDLTAPTVVVSSDDTDGVVRDADDVTITVTLSDDLGTPTIDIGTAGSLVNDGAMTNTDPAPAPIVWTYDWDVPSGNDGSHPVTINLASTEDVAGNTVVVSGLGSFTIDNTAPVITSLTSDATGGGVLGIGGTITFTVTLSPAEPDAVITPTTSGYNGSNLSWSTSDGGATYTATYTVASGQTDHPEGTPLQLTGVTATDAAGNASSASATSDVAKGIDANAPATTTITVTSTGGTVVSGYYNTSNTGVNITIPAAAMNDNSLDGGSYRILVNNTNSTTGATEILAPTAIVTADINNPKVISIPHATLSANAEYADGNSLYFFVELTDIGANETTGNLSTAIVVDRTAPGAPNTPDLADGSDTGMSNSDNVTNDITPTFSIGGTANGNTVHIFSNVDGAGLSVGNATASGASTNVTATLTTQGNGQTHSITASQTDPAGNTSPLSSALVITLDATPPTTGALTLGASETITFTFSEAVTNVTNGSGSLANFTMTGFSASVGYEAVGTSSYTNATQQGLIQSAGGGGNDWDASMTVSYNPVTGNVHDVAGNEVAAFTGAGVTDNSAPVLITGLVFNPNGAGNDIITFQVSETLNLTDNTAVAGFSTSSGTILTAIYSGKGTTNTITLTANGNVWDDNVTVIYDNATGTARDLGNNHLVFPSAFPGEPILIRNIHIVSDNANTALAKLNDDITLTFITSRAPGVTPPTVVIGGVTLPSGSITGTHPNWTATLVDADLTNGDVSVAITVQETGKSTTTTFTTDGSSVTYDETAPATPAAPDLDPASDDGFANTDNITKINNNLMFTGTAEPGSTVRLYTSGDVLRGPAAIAATPSGDYSIITNTGVFADGFYNFYVKATDAAGNESSASPVLKVKIDNTPPVPLISKIEAINPATNAWSSTNGVDTNTGGQTLTFRVTFAERLSPAGIFDALDPAGSCAGCINFFFPISAIGPSFNVPYTYLPDATYPDSIIFISIAGVQGTGTITVNYDGYAGWMPDLAGNFPNGTTSDYETPLTDNYYFTLVNPEPNGNVFTANATATGNSVTLTWPADNVAQRPTGYLVLAKLDTDANFPDPPGPGTEPQDGFPMTDAAFVKNVTAVVAGNNMVTFTGLNSGTKYDFVIYKYTNSADNINYELTSKEAVDDVETTTAQLSSIILTSEPKAVSSILNDNTPGVDVMQFKIYDDGQDPIVPNVMILNPNGDATETIVFNLRERLVQPGTTTPLANNASLTPGWFTSSTGSVASARYNTDGGSNYTITLTSNAHNAWTALTTISYNAAIGNLQFATLGKVQSINGHPVSINTSSPTNVVESFTVPGSKTWTAPPGVTSITVEAWGGGGGGAGYSNPALGGGGGGGAYSRSVITVTPGNTYTLTIGAGGVTTGGIATSGGTSSFESSVVAVGGGGGHCGDLSSCAPQGAGGVGGAAASGIGTVRLSGGNGGEGILGASGGGGGSSAGMSLVGRDGNYLGVVGQGGLAPAGGGSGGNGVLTGNAASGSFPGGGGGGSGQGAAGGSGAHGQIKITYTLPAVTPPPSELVADNAPLKFSQLVITQDAANNTAALNDWTNVIAGAELTDGTHVVTGTVNANNITFSNTTDGATGSDFDSSNPGDFGYIEDADGAISSKTYTLKVWLRSDINSTLAEAIDGMTLGFSVAPGDITFDDTSNGNLRSSRFITTHPAVTSGANPIEVVASQLVFRSPGPLPSTNTNPQAQIGVNIPFSANIAGQDPEVYALDANNNLDRDFDKPATDVTISNTAVFGQSASGMAFVDGKLSLNPFFFTSGTPLPTPTTTQIDVAVAGSPTVTPAQSTPVAPVISNLTSVTKTGTDPDIIESLTTSSGSPTLKDNFSFVITDDPGANSVNFGNNDGLPTALESITITRHADNGIDSGGDPDFDNWQNSIGGAQLFRDGAGIIPVAGNVQNDHIEFDFTTLTPAQRLAYATIADDGNATFRLRIWLKNPVDASLRNVIDGKDYVFSLANTDITVAGSSGSSVLPAQSLRSDNNKNVVEVDATQLVFTSDFGGALTIPPVPPVANTAIDFLVNRPTSAHSYTNPTVEAIDANGLRDTDYTSNATVTAAGGMTLTNPLLSVTNGVGTFPATFEYETIGDGTLTVSTADDNRVGGDVTATTNGQTVTVKTGTATVINNSETVAAATISSVTTAAPGQTVFTFQIEDDPAGTPSLQNDGNPTLLTKLIITASSSNNTVIDWQEAIAGARLEDANDPAHFIDLDPVTQIGAFSLTFTGLPFAQDELGYIGDNETKTFNLRIWLKSDLSGNQNYNRIIDGLHFGFDLLSANIETDPEGTSLLTGEQANPTDESTEVTVIATQIDFVTPAGNASTSASLNVPFAVSMEARDANGNLDEDFNGAISTVSNTTDADMEANGFTIGTAGSGIHYGNTTFTNGLFSFPADFQFTSGNNEDDVSLTIVAGGISSLPVTDPPTTTPLIKLSSSFESVLVTDPDFTPVIDIPYEVNQNINSVSTSFPVAQFKLFDGGFDGTNTYHDTDGAVTNIKDITLSVTNPQNIRSLAVYKGTTLVQAKNNADFSSGIVTFDNLDASILAPDDGSLVFTIRASFFSSPSAITDNDPIQLQVIAVTQNGGSQFLGTDTPPDPTLIGGIDGGTPGVADIGASGIEHKIEVTATSLDFTTQASDYAGINEPVGAGYTTPPLPVTSAAIVMARDIFANVDLDFDYPATISATTASVSGTAAFVDGVLDLDGIVYTSTGNGTLRVQANGLDSSNPPVANTQAIPGQLVNVVHVAATYPTSGIIQGQPGNPGDPPTASIKGGSLGLNIFGVTFTAQGATSSEPELRQFSFKFNIPYTGIFENFVVREGAMDVRDPSIGGVVTQVSPTEIMVNLSANPRQLFAAPGRTLTYYLIVDVNPGADISTPSIQPIFEDGGYGSGTDANIIVSAGTASGTFNGNVYSFASTKPPLLKTAKSSLTRPFAGQLNVDPSRDHIILDFDTEVTSLDGGLNNGAELYERSTNTKVANLIAPLGPGNYLFEHIADPEFDRYDYEDVINPLRYDIQFIDGNTFEHDEVYYVKIKQGSFNPLAPQPEGGTGISDKGLNFFGGISSNSTLYFKISSDKPVKLAEAKGTIYSNNVASISTRFDQFGTAYYLVVPQGSPAPTMSEVKTPADYTSATIAASGNYEIMQINVLQTATFSGTFISGQPYDVYVYAENDAQPVPVSAGGVFGSNLVAGSGGPTIQMTLPAVPAPYQPSYLICPNSTVLVSDPIILSESGTADFSSGASAPGTEQDFNILLPTGYSFDLETLPVVQLIGADFNGETATIHFESNSVLKVSYKNYGNASLDHIVINNMRIIGAAGSAASSVLRFYGNNTSFSTPVAPVATVGIFALDVPEFDNTYNRDNRNYFPLHSELPNGTPIPEFVNAIPSNYIDDETNANAIRLLPRIVTPNDYNASIFTGTGVTNDVLTLSAVAKNSAFNITMNHVDPNGCVLQSTQQYLVYDHISPISAKLGEADDGTTQPLVNPAFPNAAPEFISQQIVYNELAGYRLLGLTADLPARVRKGQQQQIMSGDGWREIIKRIPNTPTTTSVAPFGDFYNYTWNYSHVLNADTANVNPPVTLNPYYGSETNRFDARTNNGNTYWKGGSLGQIEFTGVFQSSADLSVTIPFRQYVEVFVPAVPLIEITSSNQSATDESDETANIHDGKTPNQHINLFQYTNSEGYIGTPIFCENGGLITLTGYPSALSGTSEGKFAIYNYAQYNFNSDNNSELLISTPGGDFTDNGNGTASLNPQNSMIKNDYNDILITYTYGETNSPAKGVGYLVIRIVPNPVASVVASSVKTSTTVYTGTDFCEGIEINFDGTDSNLASGGKTGSMETFTWNFGDESSPASGPLGTHSTFNHTYAISRPYTATLTVQSSYGCQSTPAPLDLKVGGIPQAAFAFSGVSTEDDIVFQNTSILASSPVLNDDFAQLVWTYDSINSPGVTVEINSNFNDPVTNIYADAGVYKVNLVVTSLLGCSDNISHNIVVVPRVTVASDEAYLEDFEAGDAGWQHNALSGTASSWAYGSPSGSDAKPIKLSDVNGSNIWETNLNGAYNPNEKSALYSPSFDLRMLDRPMISFDHFTHLAAGEGVVIEYSTDNKNVADPTKQWTVLGEVGSGVEWYDANGLSSQPGFANASGQGWTGQEIQWKLSKHVLDSILYADLVVFRFAMATLTSNPTLDGFAIDNFRVGNRTRVVLVENFRNLGNMAEEIRGNASVNIESAETNFFNDRFGAFEDERSVVRINYHVRFPNLDPLNKDNEQDPGARALYYGVSQTPRAKMDGRQLSAETYFSSWGISEFYQRTLMLAEAVIEDLDVAPNADGNGNPGVRVTVKALKDLGPKTVLHIAIVEKSINSSSLSTDMQQLIRTGETQFDYVLKKMLPNAAGTNFGTTLPNQQTRVFPSATDYFVWSGGAKLYAPSDDLALVVFLQDEDTREIYQTAIVDLNDPSIVTGIEDPGNTSFRVHPSPADRYITVELPEVPTVTTPMQMFDQMGKLVHESSFEKGISSKTIDTDHLAGGVYLIQVESQKGMLRKKVLVLHRN